MYISTKVKYKRRTDLEGTDSNLVIIDLEGRGVVSRIINLYRSFSPQNNLSARDKFKYQLQLIKESRSEKCLVIGDFNLDYLKVNDVNYANKNLFEDFDEILSPLELVQVVNFVTWSRLVGTTLRSSVLDHVYIKDPTVIRNLKAIAPFFGDHMLVLFNVNDTNCYKKETVKKRDWRKYSKEMLNEKLCAVEWNISLKSKI